MTETKTFVIRRSFLLPLGLLLLLALALLAVSVARGAPRPKVVILAFIILPVAVLFIESAFRRIVIAGGEVVAHKLLRRKSLRIEEISAVETVQVRKRAFLTLCAGDDFLIMSNAYADFPGLVRAVLTRVPTAAVSEETRKMAAAPPVKSTDIFSCWFAVALLALLLYLQLAGRA